LIGKAAPQSRPTAANADWFEPGAADEARQRLDASATAAGRIGRFYLYSNHSLNPAEIWGPVNG
jgi:hypothetical protein